MKKLAAVLCLSVLASLAPAQEIEVPFAIGEWAPYTGEKLANNGAACEIVNAACKAAGLKPKYIFSPWKRVEVMVAEGGAFGTFPYLKTPERAETFEFSDSIFSSSIGVMRHAKNAKTKDFKYTKVEDLKGFQVGTTAGTKAVTTPLEKAGVTFEETPLLDQSITKLEMGRVDFVIEERGVMMDAVKRLYPNSVGDFQYAEGDFKEKSSYLLLVSKKYPNAQEIMKKFNEGLKKIKDDGTAQAIYTKFGMLP